MKLFIVLVSLLFLGVLFLIAYRPIREFTRIPKFIGKEQPSYTPPPHEGNKKTVLIVAYNKGTEIFDLIAPFYLFQLTRQANVYLIAPYKSPIALMKGFFVLPHYTFQEVDALGLRPSVLVIPNLSAMDRRKPDTALINWIKEKHTDTTKVLSVCAGSFTAAATGLYDGKPLTTHASDMKMNKKLYTRPNYVTGVTYTKDSNLYSTAGVSNATEGSLALIRDLFGTETMQSVMDRIHYPHPSLQTEHQSVAVTTGNKVDIIKKTLLKKDPNIGVLLQDQIDEFNLAAVLDTYHRSFPVAIKTYSMRDAPVRSRFGLLLLPTGKISKIDALDEVHILDPEALSNDQQRQFRRIPIVRYDPNHRGYIIDRCLQRIANQYGQPMKTTVKRLLDYN